MSIKFKLPVNSRVRLKDDRADVYTFAVAGSEGIVRARRPDDMGAFPMVYIEWDHEHWTYNGESNGWTFEDHFELVENNMPEKPDRDEALRTAAEAILAAIGDDQDNSSEPEEEAPAQDEEEPAFQHSPDYEGIVEKALDFLTTSAEAFIIIGVEKIDHPFRQDDDDVADHVLVPRVYSSYRDDEAGILVETQMAALVANVMQGQAAELIHHRRKKDQ